MIRGVFSVVATALVAIGLVTIAPSPASAACEIVQVPQIINNQVVLVEQLVCDSSNNPPVGGTNDVSVPPPPAGSAACIGGAIQIGLDPDEYCFGGDEDDSTPAVTGGLVAQALRRMALPASDLVVQPPGGRTLVNFETNFFTANDQPFLRTIRLLGRPVELRIWPTRYSWHFDDGEPLTTTSPGARFPDLEITHNYTEKGAYRPSVDTTYAAEWRVGGGQWQPVNGTATISGTTADLQAIEARPTLVGHDG
jgi:hypothetical protein